jgi:ubiquinone/menaquinone biosynthesis C-methylase UbiE
MERYEKNYFEKYYKGYKFESIRFYAYRITRALVEILKPKRVLDIGCARGFHVYFFRKFGVEAYGVDISRYAIERAPKSVKRYLFVTDCEHENLPFSDGYFDLVTMFEVIEHLSNYDHALNEVNRVLSDGGKLFITTPLPPRGKDPTHVHVYDRSTWLSIFYKHGFSETTESKSLATDVLKRYRLYLPLVIKTSKDVGRALMEIISIIRQEKGQVFLLVKATSHGGRQDFSLH